MSLLGFVFTTSLDSVCNRKEIYIKYQDGYQPVCMLCGWSPDMSEHWSSDMYPVGVSWKREKQFIANIPCYVIWEQYTLGTVHSNVSLWTILVASSKTLLLVLSKLFFLIFFLLRIILDFVCQFFLVYLSNYLSTWRILKIFLDLSWQWE